MLYEFDLPIVKYYKEHLDKYSTILPFYFVNTGNSTLYAKATIVDQGNLKWTFDKGSIEKTYTINASSSSQHNEELIASTIPTETQKDKITIKIEYFEDSNLTKKFGEDILNVNIHVFIQKQDGSWTSSKYTNEGDIVFDKWDFKGIPQTGISDGSRVSGVNGNADLYFKLDQHGGSAYYISDQGLVSDASLRVALINGNNSLWIHPVKKGTTETISDKFFTAVANITQVGFSRVFEAIYTIDINDTDTNRQFFSTSNTGAKKLLFIPVKGLTPCIFMHENQQDEWTPNGKIVTQFDGVYLFNLLPDQSSSSTSSGSSSGSNPQPNPPTPTST